MTQVTTATGPLKGLRVLELGQLIAGPFCGQLFADMGADVIKVEPPGQGDPMRSWGRAGYPLWWSVVARGKRCITANLRSKEGQDLIRALVEECDFVLENFRPGTMEKWGLGYEDLKAIKPDIIMIRVSGYGQSGPYSSRPGYASVGEAMGGVRYLMGEPDRKPSRAGISLGDSLAGTFAALGALAALRHRDQSGEGQLVDASIFESVLALSEALVPEHTIENSTRERTGSTLPGIAPSNIYDCADGMIIIAANQDTVFRRLAKAIGMPELSSEGRFSSHSARGANQVDLDALIQKWTSKRPTAEVEAVMIENAVPVGKVYKAEDMLDDPHFSAREALVDAVSERWGEVKMPNVAPKLSATPGSVRWAGPDRLGQHTDDVLRDLLGLSTEDIEALRDKQIV
ncbi:MAG: CaiB/BaiF CoA-transferase family protein [Henriciella sp.]|uniref:CaiB/BaiF CoA transferase family protein n=1 Tax=Henriciella sp. TaxID=1968823 RepID=UPI003C731150